MNFTRQAEPCEYADAEWRSDCGRYSIVASASFGEAQFRLWINQEHGAPEVCTPIWSTTDMDEAQDILTDILETLEPFGTDQQQRVLSALRLLAMTKYGDVFDGTKVSMGLRGDRWHTLHEWSDEIEAEKHFVETGERRHFLKLDFSQPPKGLFEP